MTKGQIRVLCALAILGVALSTLGSYVHEPSLISLGASFILIVLMLTYLRWAGGPSDRKEG